MSQLEAGKTSEERGRHEKMDVHLGASLPGQGRDFAADQYSRKEELIGKLLERYLTQPEERGNINSMLSSPDAPLGAESNTILERFQALSLRVTHLEVAEPEQKTLRQVVDELVSIARKECTPEEREVLSQHTGHMTRWLDNDSARDAAERVHKIVSEIGKNDLASLGLETGYRINDTKAVLLEVVDQAKEVAALTIARTIETASKVIDDAKKSVTESFGELLQGIANGDKSGWSKVVDLCTKTFEETKNLLTSLWNNAIDAGREFLSSLTERWDKASSTATDVIRSIDEENVTSARATEASEKVSGAIEEVQEWIEENRSSKHQPDVEDQKDRAVQSPQPLPDSTVRELRRIPDLDDPKFAQKMLFYQIDLKEPEAARLPSPQSGESFTVLPSDPLSILALKEACHHYIREMQPRLEGFSSTVGQLQAGDHPLQLKIEELRRLAEDRGVAERTQLEGKIASLELGLDLFVKASNDSQGWLAGQFAAYEDRDRFEALGRLELERQLQVQESRLARQAEQAQMIREKNLPEVDVQEVKEKLPILNAQFFALYLATRHSADGVSGAVSQREVPYDEYKDVFAPSHREGYRMRQEVTLAGSPTVGAVDFVRQIHTIPGQAEPDVQLTSYSQEMILRHLITTAPKVVFREGSAYDVPASSPIREASLSVAEVQKAFPNGLPDGDLNEKQRHLLTALGATEIYAVLNPDVSLMGTAYPGMEQYQRLIQRQRPDLSDACVVPLREQEAIAKVKEYLSSHPGEKVALVYGAAHFFNRTSLDVNDTNLGEMPLITATDWPALQFDMLNEFLESKALTVQKSQNKELKALLALNTEEVSIATFLSVKDPELQLALLPRVIPDYSHQTRPADLERLILLALPNDQQYDVVRAEIKARASGETPRAPFDLLVSKEYDWQAVAEAESFQIDQTVIEQEHYPSRYELVRKASTVGYASYALTASAALQKEILPKVVMTGTEDEIFSSLAGAAQSPEVVQELQRHREQGTGPFFSSRFTNASPVCHIVLSQAPKSEYWKQLDWDSRAEVVQAVASVTPGELQTFLNDRILKALENDVTAHKQIFCALEIGLRTGYFQELLIEAAPYLSLSKDSSVSSGFASLLEKAADKQQWKAYQSLAILLAHEGEERSWFAMVGTVPSLRDAERSLVLSLLVDELKNPESATRAAFEPMLSMDISSEYEVEMAFLRKAFDKAA